MSKPWAILIIGNPKHALNITIYSMFWLCTFWGPGPWKEHCTNIGPYVPFEVPIYGNSGTVLFRVLDLQGIDLDVMWCHFFAIFRFLVSSILCILPWFATGHSVPLKCSAFWGPVTAWKRWKDADDHGKKWSMSYPRAEIFVVIGGDSQEICVFICFAASFLSKTVAGFQKSFMINKK